MFSGFTSRMGLIYFIQEFHFYTCDILSMIITRKIELITQSHANTLQDKTMNEMNKNEKKERDVTCEFWYNVLRFYYDVTSKY